MTDKPILTTVNVDARKNLDIRPGDTVRVMQKIQEKGKTRLQAFEGLVLAVKHGNEAGGTFTVRKVASGVGVEKTFPLYSPMIDQIEVVKRTKVRQSKLYYIREKAAKVIRRSMRNAYAVGESIESDIGEKERVVKEAEAAETARAEEEKRVADEKAAEEAKVSMSEENENEGTNVSMSDKNENEGASEEGAVEKKEDTSAETPSEAKTEDSKEADTEAPATEEAPAEEPKKD